MAAFFIMLTLILISIMWRNVLYEDTSIIPFEDNWSFWDGEKVDFENLEYISSAGLRVLLIMRKALTDKGSFDLINMNDTVKEIIETTGFDTIFS